MGARADRTAALAEVRKARRALAAKIAAKQSVKGWRRAQAARTGGANTFHGNQYIKLGSTTSGFASARGRTARARARGLRKVLLKKGR